MMGRLRDVTGCLYWETDGIEVQIDMLFEIGGGIRECVMGMDRQVFRERKLMGLGVDGYW